MIRKWALFGMPGAGKSTTTARLQHLLSTQGTELHHIRLADPLYECQREIYRIAGRPLADQHVQDGELLNFLGTHLRKINPTVLLDRFAIELRRVDDELRRNGIGEALILCDDVRPADEPFVRSCGFTLVKVTAHEDLCCRRRQARRDLSLGSATHATEVGIDTITPDAELRNDSTIDQLDQALQRLLAQHA